MQDDSSLKKIDRIIYRINCKERSFTGLKPFTQKNNCQERKVKVSNMPIWGMHCFLGHQNVLQDQILTKIRVEINFYLQIIKPGTFS